MMKTAVILPAAGLGKRFDDGSGGGSGGGEGQSKIEKEIAGKAVFLRAIELFVGRADVAQILLAVNPERVEDFVRRWGDKLRFLDVQVVPGGTVERWETVAKALEHVKAECTHIAVHDAARPMASAKLIDRVFAAAQEHGAAIPGLAVSNTLKRVEVMEETGGAADPLDAIFGSAGKVDAGEKHRVIETVSRAALMEVQTPQVFAADLLRRAYANEAALAGVTDDASLVEALGEKVVVVEGEPLNLKITRLEDAELAEALLAKREERAAGEMARKRLFGEDDDF